jgi:PTS system ascorbate-specific IIA component
LALSAKPGDEPAALTDKIAEALKIIDAGAGVVIFTDICGATPYQIAQQFVAPDKVELVCGASVPMLVRALTYRTEGLNAVVEKALSGAYEGITLKNNNNDEGDTHASS